MKDKEIIQSVRLNLSNREYAIGLVYERNRAPLLRLAISIVKDESSGQDVFHDSINRLLFHIQGNYIGEEVNIDAYLYGMVKNIAFSYLRKGERLVEYSEKMNEIPEDSIELSQAIFGGKVKSQLLSRIREMDANCFDLIMAKATGHGQIKALAEELEKNEGGLYVKLNRCRKKLLKAVFDNLELAGLVLEEMGYGEEAYP